MYSEADIQSAVAAGVLPVDAADRLRHHVAGDGGNSGVDEEHFRLLTGFNDIFVSIAAVLLLVAVAWIGTGLIPTDRGEPPSPLGAMFVVGASWGLAEFFTRKRRMALPSIILLLAFVGGVFAAVGLTITAVLPETRFNGNSSVGALLLGVSGAAAATGAWLHWRRFRVPITVAAGAVALTGAVIGFGLSAVAEAERFVLPLIFAGGVALFALAMWWDVSDRERVTKRSDVAFWLHLAAAPMIAHSVFNGLGVFGGGMDAGTAMGVVALYVLFACLALAIDRRALLVSSLAYVLFAMQALFREFGAIGLGFALTGLVIGSALLLLSAFWHPIRRAVVGTLPVDARRFLPVLERSATAQPAS